MTRDELQQIYYIEKEIKMWELELERVKTQAEVKSKKLTGMPFANTNEVNSTTEEIAIKIIDIEMIIIGKKKELEYTRYEVLKFIDNIEDSLMRMIVKYRCVDCMTWDQVAESIDSKPDAVKKMFSRFCSAQDELKN